MRGGGDGLAYGYDVFTRAQWAALARPSGWAFTDPEMRQLMALGEPISRQEVVDIYLPLAQLLALLADARLEAQRSRNEYLGNHCHATPYIIGIAGGVAVGKSTTSRVLEALLRKNADGIGLSVALLTTDGFLWPNAILEARGLMSRKGFPESYDQGGLVEVLSALRAGEPEVRAPVYSHLSYDILPDDLQIIRQPDILIVEGLNVLQVSTSPISSDPVIISDFFDFSIYVDAAETDVAGWFVERLRTVCSGPLEPESYFARFASLSDKEVTTLAEAVWEQVNLVNLRENIAPTRGRAHLIMEKGSNHFVHRILVRRS